MTDGTGSQSPARDLIRDRAERHAPPREAARGRRRGHHREFRRRDTNRSCMIQRPAGGSDTAVGRPPRASDWLAWGIFALTGMLVLAGGILTLMSPADQRGQDFVGLPNLVLTLPFVLGNALVGAMVAAKRPANPVGWLLASCGVLVALDGLARAYAIYGLFLQPGSLPFAPLMAWVNAWTWQLVFGLMLAVIPLIFPNGRPPSRAWRPFVGLALAFVVAWTLGAAFGARTIYLDWRSDYTLANPFGRTDWWVIMSAGAGPLVAIAATIGAAALVARLIGSRGEERQQ